MNLEIKLFNKICWRKNHAGEETRGEIHEDPIRILYVDKREDSQEAITLLEKSGLEFGTLPHNPRHFWNRVVSAPLLIAVEGRFIGLDEIKRFIKCYSNTKK